MLKDLRQYGSRKSTAFLLSLLCFVIILFAIMVVITLTKGTIDPSTFSDLFIPLGTALTMIAGFFFAGNVLEHKYTNANKSIDYLTKFENQTGE